MDDTLILDLLSRAPEILRLKDCDGRSQKGDVYSFAIMVQEFHTREGPWSTSYLDPSGESYEKCYCMCFIVTNTCK